MPVYPSTRPRRLRRSPALRSLVAETLLSPSNMIYPVFVKEGIESPEPLSSMPGQYRYPVAKPLLDLISRALDLGIRAFLFFGIPTPESKDYEGSPGYDPNGVVQRAVKLVKKEYGDEVVVFTDVCICGYTDHGHCGLPVEREVAGRKYRVIDNDSTLKVIARIAVSHAEAGADFVAPSGMMDGMVKAIREALDREGYTDVGIMSYAVKYASGFYGPFRDTMDSAPRFGDRRSYQMDPRNAREAVLEALLDVEEGADILMVKPALAYLDVIRVVKEAFPYKPLAAYNVSGEYSMVKAAAEKGWVDERIVVLEVLTAIRRAGADIIITYHALEAAEWLREQGIPF